ncbi:MAG TPA: alkaline phosphatase family protein, partial [Chitinophagaceae bacterium]|nr:alkaline phosphatase family protein [Chitinophagaceae bacterium]
MRCFYLFITCLWALSGSATAQTPAADVKRPKLIVGVVVDQMRWDYLYRFLPHYGPGGFKRLMQEGYSYEQTYFPFTPSLTAAGHASIFTGAFPSMHGIVGNSWYERATERRMYCTADSTVQPRGGSIAGGRMSPVHLMANTVGDELRLFTQGKSRVYGVAIKDRGAILPAGRSGNG